LFPGCRHRLAAATSILRNVLSTERSSRNATQLYTMRLLSKCVMANWYAFLVALETLEKRTKEW
jgi:hypothetical protein